MKAGDLRLLFRRRGVAYLGPLAAVSLAVLAPVYLQEAPSYAASPELGLPWTAPFLWEAPGSLLNWHRFDLRLTDALRTHDYADGYSKPLYESYPRITLSLGWMPRSASESGLEPGQVAALEKGLEK